MLKVCLVDANDRTAAVYRDIPMPVVSGWLKWEMGRKGIAPCEPGEADVVFLVHAGALDWLPKCRSELKRYRIQPLAARRAGAPYVIASRVGDVAEMLGIDEKVAAALCENPDTFDLAPTPADFQRMQGELIRWPHPPATRWQAAEVYRSRMGG